MQPTVTNQCGAHYDIALQLHPLSITSAFMAQMFSPTSKSSTSKFPARNFQGADCSQTSVSFTRSTTIYSEIEISNFNLPTIIFSIISNVIQIIQIKFFKRTFETIARSRA